MQAQFLAVCTLRMRLEAARFAGAAFEQRRVFCVCECCLVRVTADEVVEQWPSRLLQLKRSHVVSYEGCVPCYQYVRVVLNTAI